LLACLLLKNNGLMALTGNQTVTIFDLANYQQITDPSNPINLSNATLTIDSSYGLNNEPTTLFPNVFQGVGLAVVPANIVVNGNNITANWQAIVNIDAINLQYSTGKFASIATNPNFKSISNAIDVLANDSRYQTIISNLRNSNSIATYQTQVSQLFPMSSVNNEISHIQELAIGKIEQRLVELITTPINYTAGTNSSFYDHLWLKPFVTFGAQSDVPSQNIQKHKSLIVGASIGLDEINLSNTKASGISLSIAKMKSYKYLSTSKSNAYGFNGLLYGKYVNKNLWFAQWIAGFGANYANQIRASINEDLTSHNKWYSGSFQFSTGQQWENELILLKPAIGILYTFLHNEGYSENATALTSLVTFPRDYHNAYAFASIDFNNKLVREESSFAINMYAKLQYLLTPAKQSYFAKFINVDGSEFKSYSMIYRLQYKVGINAQYTRNEAFDASIGADYNFYKSFRSITAYVKLGYIF
jgi:hypothetical protein